LLTNELRSHHQRVVAGLALQVMGFVERGL
jgi:hypothetical protein